MTSAWLLLRLLVLPGQPLHELTHAAVGRRYAAETRINWTGPYVAFRWEGARPWQVVLAHLAPALIGLGLGVGLVAAALVGAVPGLPDAAWLWLAASWVYYSFPSPADLDPAAAALRGLNG